MEKKILRYTWVEAHYAYISGRANLFVNLADYDRLEAENQALRQHQTDYMEAAEETRRALQAENQALRSRVVVLPDLKALETALDATCRSKGNAMSLDVPLYVISFAEIVEAIRRSTEEPKN